MSRRGRRAVVSYVLSQSQSQASQPVINRALGFSDAFDGGTGELPFESSTGFQEAVPRTPSVHRYLDPLESPRVFLPRGRAPSYLGVRRVLSPARKFTPPSLLKAKYWLSFNRLNLPRRALVCVKRKVRRNVLFAVRVAGRKRSSPGGNGKYKRNYYSQWRC